MDGGVSEGDRNGHTLGTQQRQVQGRWWQDQGERFEDDPCDLRSLGWIGGTGGYHINRTGRKPCTTAAFSQGPESTWFDDRHE